MWLALAYTDGNSYCDCDGKCYTDTEAYTHTERCADTKAASHAAASAVKPAFNGIVFLRGLANIASPRNAYSIEGSTRSAENSLSIAQIICVFARATSDCAQPIIASHQ